jgi:uncharacterized protein (TIGR03083 family)
MSDVALDGVVRALDGFEAMLAGVAPDHWDAPSPCAGWSATDVAGHVIGNLRATEAIARGRYGEGDALDPGSAASDDPLTAWPTGPSVRNDRPECAVPEDADDLTRLLAIFGRRQP